MKITKLLPFHCRNCGKKVENKECGFDLTLENLTMAFFTDVNVKSRFIFQFLSDTGFIYCSKECEDAFIKKVEDIFKEIKKEVKK